MCLLIDMLFQLKDLEAKFVVCIPSTHQTIFQAIQEVQENSNQTITLFSFGDVEGCINILERVNEFNELEAPNPAEFTEEEMKTDCVIVFWTSGTTGKTFNMFSHKLRNDLTGNFMHIFIG